MPKKVKSPLKNPAVIRVTTIAASLLVVVSAASIVHADQYDDQINAISGQNANIQGLLNGLESQASGYQAQVSALQQQIASVRAAIASNQSQQASVEANIASDQQEVNQKKAELSATIKAMYIDGQTSTIEELATSNNLSDYVDKQEYQQTVQNDLNATITQIAALEEQLQKQKTDLDTLIASETTQNAQLAASEAQETAILNYNQGQQAAYNQQLSSNSAQIAQLRAEQIIANEKYDIGNFTSSPGNGGYPSIWADAPQDSLIDDWGMYNRECVSYTAFRVHEDYLAGKDSHDMPYWGGEGNAKQWPGDAEAAGIPVDSNPTVGSIAISTAGAFGHAMYVEAVNGDEIYVQQYNQQLNGEYSEGWRYTTNLVFIHF